MDRSAMFWAERKNYMEKTVERNDELKPKLVRNYGMARLLSVSQRTLKIWVDTYHIPHIKMGRAVLYDPDQVVAYLKEL